MLAKVIPALGISFCAFCLHELLCIFFLGDDKSDNLFTKLLVFVDLILLVCSAPVSIIVYMHDNRMEKVHEAQFRKDRAPYEAMMERKYREVCDEADSLRMTLSDLQHRFYGHSSDEIE